MIRGKIWGSTEDQFHSSLYGHHRLIIHPGASCSWHFHYMKSNGFIGIYGEVVIEENMGQHYGDLGGSYDLIDRTVLRQGDLLVVPPGRSHRFVNESSEDAMIAENYFLPELRVEDIARFGVGGVQETDT